LPSFKFQVGEFEVTVSAKDRDEAIKKIYLGPFGEIALKEATKKALDWRRK